ncbi:hypothetical protein L873DRAFT_1795694, partial [Choiromyces venosus 120613-1]
MGWFPGCRRKGRLIPNHYAVEVQVDSPAEAIPPALGGGNASVSHAPRVAGKRKREGVPDEVEVGQHSRPEKALKTSVPWAGGENNSAECAGHQQPPTTLPVPIQKEGKKRDVAGKRAKSVLVPTEVFKPTTSSSTRPSSPSHLSIWKDVPMPSLILPDLSDGSDDDIESSSIASSCALKKAKKGKAPVKKEKEVRSTNLIVEDEEKKRKEHELKKLKAISATGNTNVFNPSPNPVPQTPRLSDWTNLKRSFVDEPSSCDENHHSGGASNDLPQPRDFKKAKFVGPVGKKGFSQNAMKIEKEHDMRERDDTQKLTYTTAKSKVWTKQQPKRSDVIDSSSSFKGDNSPQPHNNRAKVTQQAGTFVFRGNAANFENESDISDEDESDASSDEGDHG